VLRDFRDAVTSGQLMVLDGGVLGNRPPSTVVDCTGPQPRIIRPGAVSLAELRAGAGMLAP
jgi:tRNA A37 threonylcarbamoyladenosine synthetase subunit TsaC/SUA5/YrdC